VGSSKEELKSRAAFGETYGRGPSALLDEMERRVLGGVWGANGYTTVAEADRLAKELSLGPADHLLDVGSGRGWPGLYLAKTTGCRLTMTDLPVEGLRVALDRAALEEIDVTGASVASAKALPFAARSFDAIVHTDVLC